jgi:hypothetical protein
MDQHPLPQQHLFEPAAKLAEARYPWAFTPVMMKPHSST